MRSTMRETDQLAFDLFNLDGILGDKMLVNGKVQPVLHVSPRRYRFPMAKHGPIALLPVVTARPD